MKHHKKKQKLKTVDKQKHKVYKFCYLFLPKAMRKKNFFLMAISPKKKKGKLDKIDEVKVEKWGVTAKTGAGQDK